MRPSYDAILAELEALREQVGKIGETLPNAGGMCRRALVLAAAAGMRAERAEPDGFTALVLIIDNESTFEVMPAGGIDLRGERVNVRGVVMRARERTRDEARKLKEWKP